MYRGVVLINYFRSILETSITSNLKGGNFSYIEWNRNCKYPNQHIKTFLAKNVLELQRCLVVLRK